MSSIQLNADVLVAGLCTALDDMRERVAALEALAASRGDDAATYQFLTRQTLAALSDETAARQQLQGRYERLLGEYRRQINHDRDRKPTELAA